MKPHEASLQEIAKGLEGLEMLSQWELSLARDLRHKAEAILRGALEGESAAGEPPKNAS
jgi:hypothetical protein